MKALILMIVVAGALASSNVQSPPAVLATVPLTIKPAPVFWPLVIGGAVVVGGAGFLGIKVLNGMLRAWEHRVTNQAPDEVVFTWAEDEYPE
jgi:hypothetical protein